MCRNVAIYIAWKPSSSLTKHVVLYTWNTFLSCVCACVRVHRSHHSDCAGCWKGIFIFVGEDRDFLLYRVFTPAQGLVGGFSYRYKSVQAWIWSPTFIKCQGAECAKLEFQSCRCLYGLYRNLCLIYIYIYIYIYIRGSLAGIATSLIAGGSRLRIPTGARNFSRSKLPALLGALASYSVSTASTFRWVKAALAWCWKPHPYSTEVKEWS